MKPSHCLAVLLVALATLASGCAGNKFTLPPDGPSLEHLLYCMEGDFDNTTSVADAERQAVEEHYPIQVALRRIPSMPDALYIEQAAMRSPDRPYRQRVYRLRQDGEAFVSEVWTLRQPALWTGAHKDPDKLKRLTEADIEHKSGCDVVLRWEDGAYVGGTEGTACASEMSGSAYATAKVTVHEGGFSSHDQGFNAAGDQVWGAVKLPYEFLRVATAE